MLILKSCCIARRLFIYDNPRQLLFHWGSNPTVSWDWWIDPNSSTYLLRDEFKHFDIFGDSWWVTSESLLWPLVYPEWTTYNRGYTDHREDLKWQLLYDRAQERANRRLKKKSMKAVRAQRLKKRDRMPGAWPI